MRFCKLDNVRKIIVGLCVALVMVFGAAINAHAYEDVEFTDTVINFDMAGDGEIREIIVNDIVNCDGEIGGVECSCGEHGGVYDATCHCVGVKQPTTVTIHLSIAKFWMGSTLHEYETAVNYCVGNEGEFTFTFNGDGDFEPSSENGRCDCPGSRPDRNYCATECYSDGEWQWLSVNGNGEHYPDDTYNVIYQYQRKRVYCDESSETCVRNIEYRCSDGYFGVPYVDGDVVRGCEICPPGRCCGVVVDASGQPVTGEHVVAVARAKDSCNAYETVMTYNDGRIILDECEFYDGAYISLLTEGYVRTEANLYGAGQCKSLYTTDYYSLPAEYDSCKTDFRLEAIKDISEDVTCPETHYRDYSSGKSVCTPCPPATVNGVAYSTFVINNDSGSFNNRIYDCATNSGPYTDSIGTFVDYGSCSRCSEDH